MKRCYFMVFIFLGSLISTTYSLRVFVYQTVLGQSHVQHIGSLIDTLVDKGHEVDLLLQVYNTNVKINGTTKASNIWRIEMERSPWFKMGHMQNAVKTGRISFFDDAWLETRVSFCAKLLDDHHLMNQLRSREYDVMVSSCWDGCGFGVAHLLGIRATTGVFATPLMFYASVLLGINGHPSYITDDLAPTKVGGLLSLADRWENLKFIFHTWLNFNTLYDGEQAVFSARYKNFPALAELKRKMTYTFVNTNEILDLPKPISAKIQYIGGIALTKPKRLEQDFEQILSLRPNGTVIFSFGSNAKSGMLTRQQKIYFLTAFSKFPEYTFLWKYDEPDDMILMNFTNVETTKWLPQTSLLYDSRVKAFISHMGLNSFIEASYAGKPLVAIPLFADQGYNTECAQRNGVAVKLDKFDLTIEKITQALTEILENPKYSKKAQQISSILGARPEDPKDNFVKRIEMAAAFPDLTDILHIKVSEVSVIEYLCLDVIGMLMVSALGSLITVYVALRYMLVNKEQK